MKKYCDMTVAEKEQIETSFYDKLKVETVQHKYFNIPCDFPDVIEIDGTFTSSQLREIANAMENSII